MPGSPRWQPVPEMTRHPKSILWTYIVRPTELKNYVNSMSSIDHNINFNHLRMMHCNNNIIKTITIR